MGGHNAQKEAAYGGPPTNYEEAGTTEAGETGLGDFEVIPISQEELSEWIQTVRRMNGLILSTLEAARRGDAQAADKYGYEVQRRLNELCQTMTSVVMDGPLADPAESGFENAPAPSEEEIPALWSSPTVQEYARALRRAAELAVAVDKERGWYPDGPSETVCDWAEVAEFEAFGSQSMDAAK